MLFFRPSSREDPRITRLRSIPLLDDLSGKELRIVDFFLHERKFLKDEVIFSEDDEGEGIFLIVSGKVSIATNKGVLHNHHAELIPGDFFGELALLDNVRRMGQATAAEDTVLLGLFREDFLSLLNAHSQIASKISFHLARHLARRFRRLAMGEGTTNQS